MLPLEKLNSRIVKSCGDIFNRLPIYADSDEAIRKVVNAFLANTDLANVLAKVAIINSLYATSLYYVFSMAKHIIDIEGLDYMLSQGAKEAVDKVRSGHGILVKKTGKEFDFYSFATKYCSFHNPDTYPICDSFIVNLLLDLNKIYCWKPKLKRNDLLIYPFYIEIIDNCLKSIGMSEANCKTADKGLWIFAKYWALDKIYIEAMSKNDQILFNEVRNIVENE